MDLDVFIKFLNRLIVLIRIQVELLVTLWMDKELDLECMKEMD